MVTVYQKYRPCLSTNFKKPIKIPGLLTEIIILKVIFYWASKVIYGEH